MKSCLKKNTKVTTIRGSDIHNAHHNLNACILMVERVPFLSHRNGSLNSE